MGWVWSAFSRDNVLPPVTGRNRDRVSQSDSVERHEQEFHENKDLRKQLSEKEEEIARLRSKSNQLFTRLSEISAKKLTEDNPNIMDLSDQNRPDKLAEQFSALYDNQWTDCYTALRENLHKTEEESIQLLLHILRTAYNICLEQSQSIKKAVKVNLLAFAGKSDGEPETALDTIIQETLHKLKSYRTKNFKAAPTDVEKAIKEELITMIGGSEVNTCCSYMKECVKICWLMCTEDPPMYIFCDKEDVFDKDHFMTYTVKGPVVSYVVWPVLYLFKDGPLMKKGVAQGKYGRRHRTNAVESRLLS